MEAKAVKKASSLLHFSVHSELETELFAKKWINKGKITNVRHKRAATFCLVVLIEETLKVKEIT